MDFHAARSKLWKLERKDLLKLLMNQKESKCLLNGFRSFYFKYEGYTFCLSEVLGKGCEIEKLRKLEKEICKNEEGPPSEEKDEASLFDCIGRLPDDLIKRDLIKREEG